MIKTIILDSEETCATMQEALTELGLHTWYDANGFDTVNNIFFCLFNI